MPKNKQYAYGMYQCRIYARSGSNFRGVLQLAGAFGCSWSLRISSQQLAALHRHLSKLSYVVMFVCSVCVLDWSLDVEPILTDNLINTRKAARIADLYSLCRHTYIIENHIYILCRGVFRNPREKSSSALLR